MGKINNNGISTATGLKIEGNTLADDREAVEFVSDLELLDYKVEGLKTWVKEDKTLYIYDEDNDIWIPQGQSTTVIPTMQQTADEGSEVYVDKPISLNTSTSNLQLDNNGDVGLYGLGLLNIGNFNDVNFNQLPIRGIANPALPGSPTPRSYVDDQDDQVLSDANSYTDSSLVNKENTSNKQNSLTVDGTNQKYPTVTAVITGLANKFNNPTGNTTQYIRGDGTLATLPAGGTGTVTNVTGTTNQIDVTNPTSTPNISISSTYTAARDAIANGKVTDAIVDGVTNVAPSQNAVFDALVLKENVANKQNSLTTDGTGTKYPTVDAVNTALAGVTATPDATSTVKGKIKLAGDLGGSGGTADLPKVDLNNVTETTTTFLGKVSSALITSSSRLKFGWVTGDQQATQNTDGKLFFNEGMHVRNGLAEAGTNSLDVSLTQNSRTYAKTYMDGDSMTAGYLLANSNQSWPSKFGYYNSLNFTNGGVSGQTTSQLVKGLYDSTPYELKFIAIGVNDLRLYGSTAATPYSNLIRTKILQSYGTDATKGQQMTYSGTDWTTDQLQSDTTTGIKTTTNSSPATCVRIGTSVYVTIAYENLSNATYTISIDGVQQGGTFTADSYAAFPGYPTASGAASVAYYPYTHRFSGLSVGQHTVSIVKTGGASNLRVIGVMSNAGLKTSIGGSGLSQYVFSVWKMNTVGYTTYPGNTTGLSDATTDTYNAALYTVVNELATDGLNVMYYDVNTVAPPIDLYMMSDGLHRTELAYTAVALDLTTKIFPAANREHYLTNQLPLILAGKVGFSDLGTYVDLSSAQTITGTKTFTVSPRISNIVNSAGSTTQGSLVQSNATQGWGLVRNSTNAAHDAGYSENTNSANVGYLHSFYSSTTGSRIRVAGFNNIGQLEIPNATANNHAVNLSQLNSINPSLRSGQNTQSGTGAATSFTITHGLSGITTTNKVFITPRTLASANIQYVDLSSTTITIFYSVAPTSGTNNLKWDWQII